MKKRHLVIVLLVGALAFGASVTQAFANGNEGGGSCGNNDSALRADSNGEGNGCCGGESEGSHDAKVKTADGSEGDNEGDGEDGGNNCPSDSPSTSPSESPTPTGTTPPPTPSETPSETPLPSETAPPPTETTPPPSFTPATATAVAACDFTAGHATPRGYITVGFAGGDSSAVTTQIGRVGSPLGPFVDQPGDFPIKIEGWAAGDIHVIVTQGETTVLDTVVTVGACTPPSVAKHARMTARFAAPCGDPMVRYTVRNGGNASGRFSLYVNGKRVLTRSLAAGKRYASAYFHLYLGDTAKVKSGGRTLASVTITTYQTAAC